jgi:hypothetical protein
MVLDDLGLGPTIRRVASDRARRSGISVDFVSHGIEERLDPDVESAVFRSVDEAISGYLALEPPSVVVRLDWAERELVATVAGTWPRVRPDGGVGVQRGADRAQDPARALGHDGREALPGSRGPHGCEVAVARAGGRHRAPRQGAGLTLTIGMRVDDELVAPIEQRRS